MSFTSFIFLLFLATVLGLYWVAGTKTKQNLILLISSYFFYGFIHPWFCLLIAASTTVDYVAGQRINASPTHKKFWLTFSLIFNLGMLGVFKYFNFFLDSFLETLNLMGLEMNPIALRIFLPVGISFYTFQTLSYTLDIYYQRLEPRRSFLDFAVFVSFFPQLVAGPIERARNLLPQIETRRIWRWENFHDGFPLILRGYLKKLVIADNVAVYVDKIFLLDSPPAIYLVAGGLGFALQIYADFSAYTDIARGTARLFGISLMVNFRSPYLAITPSDFWRRWHISFSTWIRDYLFIPLGGSRVASRWAFLVVVLTSMGLSGLWHGASWHFVAWGLYHGLLLFLYHQLGMGGQWVPSSWLTRFIAWAAMFTFTMFGWLLFRTENLGWLLHSLTNISLSLPQDVQLSGSVIFAMLGLYTLPLLGLYCMDAWKNFPPWGKAAAYSMAAFLILTISGQGQDFIYFQF